ncbi:MAG: PD40 domain-containing protein [Ignavibacteriales bacterium]|nr:PD40 domain-containing protein [Ignavibacteriales bacterium]
MEESKSNSGKKEKIMFTSKRDDNFEVYIMDEDGNNVSNLSQNSSVDYGINWSPDGNKILFYSDRSGNEEIWQMDLNGSNQVNLTNAPSNERNAVYSPDGKTIAFTSDRDNKIKDIYLMDREGKNVRRLTHNKVYCESPEWTKDGNHIIFTLLLKEDNYDKSSNGELFIINISGTNLKRLTYKNGFDSGADFHLMEIRFLFTEDLNMGIWTFMS